MSSLPHLICPAGSLPALKAAVDNGADAVYLGFRNATNARNFSGLNFDAKGIREGIQYARSRGRSVLVAINTFAQPGRVAEWQAAVDAAADYGVDAVILADVGLLDYAARRHPELRLHLSVQGSATNYEAIEFCRQEFGIRRAVLPRVLTVQEIATLVKEMGVEAEVFAFGSLGTMTEGRCILSSYLTGRSPSSDGVCAPAEHVAFAEEGDEMVIRLGGLTMNRFPGSESAGYPTPCKARLVTRGVPSYLFDEPVGLNTIDILPQLKGAGVTALKIEGRQRSRAYVTQVVKAFRATLDALDRNESMPQIDLSGIVEGRKETFGAFRKGWR